MLDVFLAWASTLVIARLALMFSRNHKSPSIPSRNPQPNPTLNEEIQRAIRRREFDHAIANLLETTRATLVQFYKRQMRKKQMFVSCEFF